MSLLIFISCGQGLRDRGMEGGTPTQYFGLSGKSGFRLTNRGIMRPKSKFHLAKLEFKLAKIGVYLSNQTQKSTTLFVGADCQGMYTV